MMSTQRQKEQGPTSMKPGKTLRPVGLPWDQDSDDGALPLKSTLETIEEDAPKPHVSHLRSKSLPTQRRVSLQSSTGYGLHRPPNHRRGQGQGQGQGQVFLPGACGVSMSGPILPSTYDYDFAPTDRRSRFSTRISKVRATLRSGSRLRQALNSVLSRMRPASRRSR